MGLAFHKLPKPVMGGAEGYHISLGSRRVAVFSWQSVLFFDFDFPPRDPVFFRNIKSVIHPCAPYQIFFQIHISFTPSSN